MRQKIAHPRSGLQLLIVELLVAKAKAGKGEGGLDRDLVQSCLAR